MPTSVAQLADELLPRIAASKPPLMLGIAGPPGSGKSTLAQQLAQALNARRPDAAHLIAMDGFHLPNAQLDRLNLRHRKGAPHTFDAQAFLTLLRRVRAGEPASAPVYSRQLHEPVAGALPIPARPPLVIVEGNYLLLDDTPWRQLPALLDETWYLDTPLHECMKRVEERHRRGGLSADQAAAKLAANDILNASLVAASRRRAHRVLTL